MTKEHKQAINDAMLAIVMSGKSARIEAILAAQILLATAGVFIPAVDERWLSVRQITKLRRWQQETVEKVLQRKERKKHGNRKQYLKTKLRKLEAEHEQQAGTDCTIEERTSHDGGANAIGRTWTEGGDI